MDATEILEKLKDYDFGAVEIDELHLSQRRAARDVTLYVALVLHRLDFCSTPLRHTGSFFLLKKGLYLFTTFSIKYQNTYINFFF